MSFLAEPNIFLKKVPVIQLRIMVLISHTQRKKTGNFEKCCLNLKTEKTALGSKQICVGPDKQPTGTDTEVEVSV